MLRAAPRLLTRAGVGRLACAARPPPLARSMATTAPTAPDTSGRTPERTAELERLAEEHNGFLFGEVPPPEGQSRQWEDWEYSYTPMMTSAFLIWGVAYYYQPKRSQDWAREEALRRMEAAKEDGEEEEDE